MSKVDWKRIRRSWLAALLLAGAAIGAAPSAAGAAALSCSGSTIYAIQRPPSQSAGNHGVIFALAAGTVGESTATMTEVSAMPGNSYPNALGIAGDGSGLYAVDQAGSVGGANVWAYDATSETWTSHASSGGTPSGFVAGAVDPVNGIYYYADYTAGTVSTPGKATVYGFNTNTNTAIAGVIATFNLPDGASAAAQNGDFTFDANGNLFVLASDATTRALGVIKAGEIPTTGTGAELSVTVLSSVADSNTYNGIAFDNLGNLFLEGSKGSEFRVTEVDPNNGETLAGPTPYSANAQTSSDVDLASCAKIPTLTAQVDITNRFNGGDQFHLEIAGGTITEGNAATTSGSTSGVQSQIAGPVIAGSATEYTFTATTSKGKLSNYNVGYSCIDTANGNAVVASGSGSTFKLTFPTVTLGQPTPSPAITCTFTATPKEADLEVKDSVAPETTTAGNQVVYTLTVVNNGPDAATGAELLDTLPAGLTIVSTTTTQGTCSNTASELECELGSLVNGAGAKVTITASVESGTEGLLSDAASTTANQLDPNTSNNTAAALLLVTGPETPPPPPPPPPPAEPAPATQPAPGKVDVEVTTRVNHPVVQPGEEVIYTITITNLGSETAPGVIVVNTPSGPLTILSVTTSQGTCSSEASVSCLLASIGPGGTVTITIRGVVTGSGPVSIDANASVGCTTSGTCPKDVDLKNNASPATVTAHPLHLRLRERVSRRVVKAGHKVLISLHITNPNNRRLTGTRVCTTLPPGLVFVSSKRKRITFTDGMLCWHLGTLAKHRVLRIRVLTRALRGAAGIARNHAVASARDASPARARGHVMIVGVASDPSAVTG